MVAIAIVLVAVLLCFSFVLLFGAPYLPTLGKQVEIALDLAALHPGQTLLELGSGDGRVLLAAAKRGYIAVGYELNPLLVLVSMLRTWPYRKQVHIHWGSFWSREWPQADAIFVFGLQRIMPKLDKKIMQLNCKPVKVVSFAFVMPDREPTATNAGLYLYEYGDA